MAYERPKLIDLNGETEKGYGQQHNCEVGSQPGGNCLNGFGAYGCGTGSTAMRT